MFKTASPARNRVTMRAKRCPMDSTTLIIVIVVLVLLLGGGGGYYGRRSGWGGPHYGGGLLGLILLILLLLWLTGKLGGPGRLRPRVDRMPSVTDVRT